MEALLDRPIIEQKPEPSGLETLNIKVRPFAAKIHLETALREPVGDEEILEGPSNLTEYLAYQEEFDAQMTTGNPPNKLLAQAIDIILATKR